MPLILVVDRDERVPKRVRQALGTEGWTVTHARDVTEALQSAGSEAPDLFLVASELTGAGNLLGTFARRKGGPGTLALVPETEGGAVSGQGEDGTVPRSFDDSELRTAVEHILRTPDRPARAKRDEPKLTSHDIFGDLVAEVERETGVRDPVPPRPPAPRAAAPGSGGPSPPKRSAKRSATDDDIERKLEQTLSGVLGMSLGDKPGAARTGGASRPSGGGARRESDDLDKLISDTLSGLDLPGTSLRKRRPMPEAPRPASDGPSPAGGPPAGERTEPPVPPPVRPERPALDFSEIEALVDRPKKAPPAAPAQAAPPPPSEPVPPPASTPSSEPAPPEAPADRSSLPFGSLFSDTMQEVPEAEADDKVSEAAAGGASEAGRGGREFGQYHLLDRIGVGGMAEVWKARMRGVEGFQKTVAIKRILPHLTDSPDFVDMFVDEAKLAAQLNHANIIHIYDLGKLGDDYYIAMEYVEGENLRAILNRARERSGALPPGLALYVGARLASALDYAHRKRDFEDRELGLVHRDVSPQNVLVGYEGTIKLCDFGIVKAVSKSSHTQMGALKGKLQYMSPEQAWGRAVDGRSDIFSLGCLLFEMLTGRRLFVGESELEVLEAVRECRVQAPTELRPDLDPAIDEVVLKALAREPELRFQTAGELERRLEGMLSSLRPSPGQSELTSFMARLFDREADAEEVPAEEPVGEPQAAPPPAPAAPAPPKVAEPTPAPVAAATPPPAPEWDREDPDATSPEAPPAEAVAPAAGREAVEAVAPVRAVEPEEGGRRGKALLVAAIVAAVLLGGLLAWYLLWRDGGGEETETAPPPAAEEPVAPPPAPEPRAVENAPEGAAGAAGTTTDGEEAEPEPSAAAPGSPAIDPELTETIDQAVEEELARREEILRQQFEQEERRLQRQLQQLEESAERDEARVRAMREAAEAEPAGGSAESSQGEAAPPPSPTAAPAPPPPNLRSL